MTLMIKGSKYGMFIENDDAEKEFSSVFIKRSMIKDLICTLIKANELHEEEEKENDGERLTCSREEFNKTMKEIISGIVENKRKSPNLEQIQKTLDELSKDIQEIKKAEK